MKKLLLFGAFLFWLNALVAQTNFINQDSIFTRTAICDAGVSVCIDSFVYDSINSLRFYLNGRQFSTTFEPCTIDTIHNYGYTDIFRGLERGPWHLDSWTVSGQIYTGIFSSLEILVDSMRRWDPSGDWRLEPVSMTIYGFAKNGRQYSCQNITGLGRGGRSEICYNSGIQFRGLRFTVPTGISEFVVEKTVSGLRDTVQLITACVKPDVVRQTVPIGSTKTYCFDASQLLGVTGNLVNFCAKPTTHVIFDAPSNSCIRFAGATVGSDTACLKVCDQFGNCDTTTLIVTAVISPTRTTIIRDTVVIGNARTNTDVIIPIGTTGLFGNICPRGVDLNVNFIVDSLEKTLIYSGITEGVDTACIRVCNTLGICDTTIFYITAVPEVITPQLTVHTFRDTITIGLAARSKCTFDAPIGTSTIFENFCSASSGSKVKFTIDAVTKCIKYQGFAVGTDSACIRVCNDFGQCDTTYLYIQALLPVVTRRVHEFRDTITVGLMRDKCNLAAPSSPTRIRNICEGQSGSNIDFMVNSATRCANYMGVTPGTDTACVEICDGSGLCDTTYMYITGVAPPALPLPSADTISLKIFETKAYCLDSTELRGSPIRYIAFCSVNPFDNSTVTLDTIKKCVNVRGISNGQDTFCFVLCNNAGFCDTTTLYVNVSRDTVIPTLKMDSLKIFVGDSLTYCGIDTSEIRGAVDSIFNYCAQSSGINSTVQIIAAKCLTIKGLRAGTDTACIVVCNRLSGLCDTTRVRIIVSEKIIILPKPSIDSVTVSVGQSKTYCPDSTELSGSPITSIQFCSIPSGNRASITLDNVTKCVKIVGNTEGLETACIILSNAAGLHDTTTLYIRVTQQDTSKPVSSTVFITLDLNKDSTFCGVDSLQIRGSVDTIYDACLGKNGLHALMVLNRTTKCVKITGQAVGRDTMCLVVHNRASGLYDTTFIIVNVRNPVGIIVKANNDLDTVRRGTTKELFVYLNDTLSRQPTSLMIITPPTKGTADSISFQRGILTYTASRAYSACGIDSFRYRVCIDSVCSEATVVIVVVCPDSLLVYNGISPNGDGKNDTWLIEGLQNYPNHTISVLNRWGNEVLKTTNYQNNWEGKWDGKDLPDGTYFYWIRNDDNGEILKTGYLQIMR
jgi:gliding motility-associated-like protein